MTPEAKLAAAMQAAHTILHKASIVDLYLAESPNLVLQSLCRETNYLLEMLDELRENPVIEAVQLTDREHFIVANAMMLLINKVRVESGQKVGDEETATGFLAEVQDLYLKMPSPKLRDSKGKELYY